MEVDISPEPLPGANDGGAHSLQQVCLESIVSACAEFCLPNRLPVSLFLELKITAQGQQLWSLGTVF